MVFILYQTNTARIGKNPQEFQKPAILTEIQSLMAFSGGDPVIGWLHLFGEYATPGT